ncbi:hypothetical protein SAMN06309944_1985 [Micrococcales bacterium KH10]|nr:hypothetical protein SAMN06309944_1985 [Micrococcales bacterium KH10]
MSEIDSFPDLSADPTGFLQELHRRAEIGRRTAAARPGWQQVATVLLALQRSAILSLWGGPDTARNNERPLTPRADAAGVSPGTTRLNPENSLVLGAAHTYLWGVRDHLQSVAMMCLAELPPRSIIAMSRVLLDAATRTTYILNASIDERTRVIRACNLRFESFRQQLADHPKDIDKRDELSSERQNLLDAALADGFSQVITKAGKPEWMLAPRTAAQTVEMFRDAYGEEFTSLWRELSSVTHVDERPHFRFAFGLDSTDAGPHAATIPMIYIHLATIGVISALETAERFYGTAGTPIDHDTKEVTHLVLRMASGLLDDFVRAEAGIS